MDGTSSGTQWSRRDAQRRMSGTETNRPSKCVSEIFVESTHATDADKLEETDKSFSVEPHVDGEQ